MSRNAVCLALAVLLGAALPAGARAQNAASDSDRRIDDAISAQKSLLDTRSKACRPENQVPGQIVVCRTNEENDRQKLPLPVQQDTSNTTADGAPRAPNVSGLPDCSKGGCIGFGKAPVPVYYFDITKLPEPPAGSDAEKIARGEMAPP